MAVLLSTIAHQLGIAERKVGRAQSGCPIDPNRSFNYTHVTSQSAKHKPSTLENSR